MQRVAKAILFCYNFPSIKKIFPTSVSTISTFGFELKRDSKSKESLFETSRSKRFDSRDLIEYLRNFTNKTSHIIIKISFVTR